MRRWPSPVFLLAAGGLLLIGVLAALVVSRPRTRTIVVTSTVTRTVTAAATTTQAAPATAPPDVAFSWRDAGGLVVNLDSVDPTNMGHAMRNEGFGWVAVQIADGATVENVRDWVVRFKAASGLPVGGWSVLRDDPKGEARLAAALVRQDGLDFFVADAEREYEYTNDGMHSSARFARSREFVAAFRAAEPSLPAAVSSYCRPDMHDIDWATWASAGFDFLPQAYVGDLGADGEPAVCTRAAARFFPPSRVHPTIGIYPGPFPTPTPAEYTSMLQAAGTTGFSIYPAENADPLWQAFGQALLSTSIAERIS